MSQHLQRDLDELKKDLLQLGIMVENAVNKAILALNNREPALADEVMKLEDAINSMEVEIEEKCLKTLALNQPVATDLRFIVVVLKVNNDLERMGDFAQNIAARAVYLCQHEHIAAAPEFVNDMPKLVRRMVRQSLDALVRLDVELAREVIEMDSAVDAIHRKMYADARRLIEEDVTVTDQVISLLSCSRYIERIADLSENIAEDVIFMVEGRVIRHNE